MKLIELLKVMDKWEWMVIRDEAHKVVVTGRNDFLLKNMKMMKSKILEREVKYFRSTKTDELINGNGVVIILRGE